MQPKEGHHLRFKTASGTSGQRPSHVATLLSVDPPSPPTNLHAAAMLNECTCKAASLSLEAADAREKLPEHAPRLRAGIAGEVARAAPGLQELEVVHCQHVPDCLRSVTGTCSGTGASCNATGMRQRLESPAPTAQASSPGSCPKLPLKSSGD